MNALAESSRIELWLELETRCNLACKFCYNYWKDGSSPAPDSKSTAKISAALTLLIDRVGLTQVAFSGGEPLLRHDLPELISLVRSYDVPVIVTTNGTLLVRERIESLRKAGVSSFQVPIHSHRSDVHDLLTGGPSWAAALAAIIRLRELGSPVVPVFVATTMNLDHFPRVLEMLAQLGIKKSIFNRFIPTGLGNLFKNEIGVPSDVQLAEVISEADETAHRWGVEVQLGTPVEVSPSVSANWRNVRLASCPIEVGQRRWALSSDLNLRRCNQSGTHVGSVFGTGMEIVLAESKQKERGDSKAIRRCAHLEADPLVQLRPISNG